LRPEGARDQRGVSDAHAELRKIYGLIEEQLDGRTWIVGSEFSLADCAAAPALFYAGIVSPFSRDYPEVTAYFDRLVARPSFARVLAEARPYFHLFPFRDDIARGSAPILSPLPLQGRHSTAVPRRSGGRDGMMQTATQPVVLDRMFHALADATRREMVDRLSAGPVSVKELAAPFAMALPSVMKHLAVLESGGLVRSAKVGRVRTYRIAPDGLMMIERWVNLRKAAWNRSFDRLEAFLEEDETEEGRK
jgi:DNA-binding transcriptional ArsR family regulator